MHFVNSSRSTKIHKNMLTQIVIGFSSQNYSIKWVFEDFLLRFIFVLRYFVFICENINSPGEFKARRKRCIMVLKRNMDVLLVVKRKVTIPVVSEFL